MPSVKEPGTESMPAISAQALRVQLESIALRVVSGPDAGLEASFCLPTLRIGSADDNDLVLSDRAVSRHHAEIRMTPKGLILCDLGSTNGTFIGKLRVTEAYLTPGTECILGYSSIAIEQRTEERHYAPSMEDRLGELVGASPRMRELYGLLRAVAPTSATVLINGESGSGKELVAKTLHELSSRSGSLVVFDASVTDLEMVRNDLFGHVKGAFTGATGAREGAFRQAHQGTLFIDEIGELPLELQPRLLRVLENRELTPIGADTSIRVDVRVVAATHRNLEAMVKEGSFRADLFYRLSVMPIKVPPLREIKTDLPLLVQNFCDTLQLNGRISDAAMWALQTYAWPGNVRELRNVLERAAVLSQGQEIQPDNLHLPNQGTVTLESPPSMAEAASTASLSQLRELERKMILEALERTGNNKAAAARELGIPLSTLKRRLKDYQV